MLPGIVIVEDHPLVREGLTSYFNETKRWQVTGTAANLDEAKELLTNHKPDILLLDIQLEDGLGLNIIPWLKANAAAHPHPVLVNTVVAVYSAFNDFVHVSAAISMGVRVYMCKRRSVSELESALLKALKGETFIDDTVQSKLDNAADIFSLLTRREMEILALVNRGLPDKQIAQRLGISPRTVQNIIYCIYDKTGIRSRQELQKL